MKCTEKALKAKNLSVSEIKAEIKRIEKLLVELKKEETRDQTPLLHHD